MKPPESFVRRTVRPLAAYGPPRDPAAVPLYLNESPTDLPQDLKAELCDRILQSDWSKYPISDGARLAADLAAAYGLDPAGVLVGNGSNELLQLLLFACIEPGDEVVVAAPSFALYSLQAAALGARVVEVRLRARDGAFRFPVDELLRSAQNARTARYFSASCGLMVYELGGRGEGILPSPNRGAVTFLRVPQ